MILNRENEFIINASFGEQITRKICSIYGENFVKEVLTSFVDLTITEILDKAAYKPILTMKKILNTFQNTHTSIG